MVSSLSLGHSRQNVDCELICLGHIAARKFHAIVHQRSQEANIARQTIQFGYDQLDAMNAAQRACASCGRSESLPDSTSVNSATRIQRPLF